jgi:hypothetical protein
VNLFHRIGRGIVAAFFGLGVLLGSSAPQAAYALPSDPTEQCIPQPVTAADAELLGTLRLLEAAVVGYESRISMQAPGVRIPDPRCDGQYIQVPLVYRWDVLSRPAGSTAQLTQTTGLTARIRPDAAGDWQAAFTACPLGCKVTGTTITVPPLRRTLSFTSSVGIEGRLDSTFLDQTLKLYLTGSRIQISHTGAGSQVVGTPYDVAFYPLTPLYQRTCLDVADPPAECDQLLESIINHVTFQTITPTFSSFIDFSPTAEAQGAPPFIVLPIEPHEHDIPLWKRAVFMALQPASLVSSIDVDHARLLTNNIHLDMTNLNRWEASMGGSSLDLKLSFESDHPTIKCLAHFVQRVGFIFSINSGWADELCPDYDLSQMDMTIHVFPAVQNDAITVLNVTVDVQLKPQGLQSDLIDYFTDVSAEQEVKIAEKVRNRLIEPENRAKLGTVLMKVLQHKFPNLVRVRSSQIAGGEWVVRYEQN